MANTPESVRYIGGCARSPTQQEGTHAVPTRGNLGAATLKTKQQGGSEATRRVDALEAGDYEEEEEEDLAERFTQSPLEDASGGY